MADRGFTPFTEPEIVAAYLQPLLRRLAEHFSDACERTSAMFAAQNWSRDAALAAYLVRKEVFERLRAEGTQVEEEDVEVERKALCGLLLTLPSVRLKIRKSKDGEIPAAGSEQTLSFYNWNLLVFPQEEGGDLLPLHLLLLWNDDRRGELDTMLLACVEGAEWRWRIPVFQREAQVEADPGSSVGDAVADTSADYTSAFDSGNEDLPLKVSDDRKEDVSQPAAEKAKSGEDDEQQDPQKKAQ